MLRLADCLAEDGTIVNYGLLSGQPCMLGAHHTIFKGITLTGFWLQRELTQRMSRERIVALYADLAARIARGELEVPIAATYPIERIGDALAHAEQEARGGKILVLPNGPVG